jgi:hypothetical protein
MTCVTPLLGYIQVDIMPLLIYFDFKSSNLISNQDYSGLGRLSINIAILCPHTTAYYSFLFIPFTIDPVDPIDPVSY